MKKPWLFPPRNGLALAFMLFVFLPAVALGGLAFMLAVIWWIGWL